MRKAFRHTGVLMMAAVAALGLLGAAYTLWFEDLELHADVKTGEFNVDWSIEGPAHPVVSTNLGAGPFLEYYPAPQGKGPNCYLDEIGHNPYAANDKGDFNVLNLKIDNAYPYSGCEIWIDIHNSGTVPAHLTAIPMPGNPPPAPLAPWANAFVQDTSHPACHTLFGENVPALAKVQLHPGDKIVCHIVIWLQEEAEVPCGYGGESVETTCTDNYLKTLPEKFGPTPLFWWYIRGHQWNESWDGGPGGPVLPRPAP